MPLWWELTDDRNIFTLRSHSESSSHISLPPTSLSPIVSSYSLKIKSLVMAYELIKSVLPSTSHFSSSGQSNILLRFFPLGRSISIWPARLEPQWHTGRSPWALIIFLLHICNTTPMLFWKYYLTLCASMNTSLSKWSKVRKCLWFLNKLPALSWSCMS